MHVPAWLTALLLALLLVGCGVAAESGGSAPSDEGTGSEVVEVEAEEAAPTETALPPTPRVEVTVAPVDSLPGALGGDARNWNTDWSQRTISLDELFSGGPPRDGIPPIDEPKFLSIEEASEQLVDAEPVMVFANNGEAHAYPLAILIWHEIVNDEVGGMPVSITYCPLCNTAIAFDRQLGDRLLDFGTSGLLRNSDLVMWDRQTESLWQQATGEGIVGELAGHQLTFLPASLLSFQEFREAYPEGEVLSRETGHRRAYGRNPYTSYDRTTRPFLFTGQPDERLPAMERVVGLTIGEESVAYPFSVLVEQPVVNDEFNGQPIVILYAPDQVSALDASSIASSRSVGSAVAYSPVVEGQRLTFEWQEGTIVDQESGSEWDVTGHAVAGPLEGAELEVLPHANHFWFAFAAFFPDAELRE